MEVIALKLPKSSLSSKQVLRKETIGTTTVLQYDVYSDGSYSQPIIVSSYNFVPNARKKQVKQKKQAPKPKFIMHDEEEI